MKTAQNVAKVSAQMIRAGVKDLAASTLPDHGVPNASAMRRNALDSMQAVAEELEQLAMQHATTDEATTDGSTTSV